MLVVNECYHAVNISTSVVGKEKQKEGKMDNEMKLGLYGDVFLDPPPTLY